MNRATIGALVKMVANIATIGYDSLRIAEIAKDLRLTSIFSLAQGAEKDGCFDFFAGLSNDWLVGLKSALRREI